MKLMQLEFGFVKADSMFEEFFLMFCSGCFTLHRYGAKVSIGRGEWNIFLLVRQ